MPAILSKPISSSSAPQAAGRRSRAARMAAKAKVTPVTAEPGEAADAELDEELEVDHEVDQEALTSDESAGERRKADGGTYLSMYFRDMATLDVLRPEEEFTSAREIEALEVMLWETMLGFPAAVDMVL